MTIQRPFHWKSWKQSAFSKEQAQIPHFAPHGQRPKSKCRFLHCGPNEQTRSANADPSTHHPQTPPQRRRPVAGDPGTEVRLGPLSLRMTVHFFCNSLKESRLLPMDKTRKATADPSTHHPPPPPQRRRPVAGDPGTPPQRRRPVAGDPGTPPQRRRPVAGDPGNEVRLGPLSLRMTLSEMPPVRTPLHSPCHPLDCRSNRMKIIRLRQQRLIPLAKTKDLQATKVESHRIQVLAKKCTLTPLFAARTRRS